MIISTDFPAKLRLQNSTFRPTPAHKTWFSVRRSTGVAYRKARCARCCVAIASHCARCAFHDIIAPKYVFKAILAPGGPLWRRLLHHVSQNPRNVIIFAMRGQTCFNPPPPHKLPVKRTSFCANEKGLTTCAVCQQKMRKCGNGKPGCLRESTVVELRRR